MPRRRVGDGRQWLRRVWRLGSMCPCRTNPLLTMGYCGNGPPARNRLVSVLVAVSGIADPLFLGQVLFQFSADAACEPPYARAGNEVPGRPQGEPFRCHSKIINHQFFPSAGKLEHSSRSLAVPSSWLQPKRSPSHTSGCATSGLAVRVEVCSFRRHGIILQPVGAP